MEQEEIIKQINQLQKLVETLLNTIEGMKTDMENFKETISSLRSKDVKYRGIIGRNSRFIPNSLDTLIGPGTQI